MASTTVPNPSQKRKTDSIPSGAESDNPPPSKKKTPAPKSTSKNHVTTKPPTYTPAELSTLSHADLLAHAIVLQKQLDAIPSARELSPAEISKKVQTLQTLMERQIRKSMIWKPSCKTGSATFSQDFIVQSESVLKALFKRVIKEGAKAWKMKKFSLADFEKVVGDDIQASTRYCNLVLTSDVTVRWDAENGRMKCSGKYGKMGTGRAATAIADAEDDEL